MRKKAAIVLAFAMLNWNMNVLADTENRNSDFIEETSGVSAEAENSVQNSSEALVEQQEDAQQSDDMPSMEEQMAESRDTEESTKAPESTETPESIKAPESAERKEETEEGITETREEIAAETAKEVYREEKQEILPQEETKIQETVKLEEKSNDLEAIPERQRSAGAEDIIYNVLFPTVTSAYLDPGDLSGRGQIFSDRYEVENYGNTDVAIKIKNIEIHYPSTEEKYEFTSDEFTKDDTLVKKINVDMVWENEDDTSRTVINLTEGFRDEYVLQLKAAEYDEDGSFLGTKEGGMGWFYFTGSMDSDLELDWEDEKVTVSFYYEIVNPDDVNALRENKKVENIQSTPYEAENGKDGETVGEGTIANNIPAVLDAEKENPIECAVESTNSAENAKETTTAESPQQNKEEDEEEKGEKTDSMSERENLNIDYSQAAS